MRTKRSIQTDIPEVFLEEVIPKLTSEGERKEFPTEGIPFAKARELTALTTKSKSHQEEEEF